MRRSVKVGGLNLFSYAFPGQAFPLYNPFTLFSLPTRVQCKESLPAKPTSPFPNPSHGFPHKSFTLNTFWTKRNTPALGTATHLALNVHFAALFAKGTKPSIPIDISCQPQGKLPLRLCQRLLLLTRSNIERFPNTRIPSLRHRTTAAWNSRKYRPLVTQTWISIISFRRLWWNTITRE